MSAACVHCFRLQFFCTDFHFSYGVVPTNVAFQGINTFTHGHVARTHTHIHTQRVVVVLLLISTGFDGTLGYPGEGPNDLDVRATLGGTVKVIKTRLQKLELSLDNVQTLITAETKDENRKGVLRLLNVLLGLS